jgi:hypothetical protein
LSETIDAYPLQWPPGWQRTPGTAREGGCFKGTLDAIRRELLIEIDAIVLGRQARTHTIRDYVVVSTNFPLRRDGEIHAGAREPDDPGVAVYFKRKGKPVCLACDKYDRVWKNMRAIQKSIEAMRGIERWGSSQLLDRAFTGFAALPQQTQPKWFEILDVEETDDLPTIEAARRTLVKHYHPDGSEPDAVRFAQVSEAYRIALEIRKGTT